MSFTTYITVTTGDPWSAANNNTYNRDNINTLWPYLAAGDLAYASGPTTLARLAKPSSISFLQNDNSGVPSWVAKNLIGGIHAKGIVDFAPSQTFAGAWADVTGATITLVLSVTCTVIVFASVTGYNTLANAGRNFFVRAMVDGVADGGTPTNMSNGSAATPRNEALSYIYYATGVAAGSRIAKLQCQADTDSNFVTKGRLTALAFVE